MRSLPQRPSIAFRRATPHTDILQELAWDMTAAKPPGNYPAFLNQVNQGEQAERPFARFKQWGSIR